MIERLDYVAINGTAIAGMAQAKTLMPSIDRKLRALIELRVSQINGCAYCVDLHSKEALGAGETAARLECLDTWRQDEAFDPAEKAAFAWAEAVTLISAASVSDEIYANLMKHYSEQQVVDLTLIIAQMNAWNRLAVSFRHEP